MEKVKTLIIGGGPAGYTAATYAGRANIQPVFCSGLQPGGQLTTTIVIENSPDFHEGIDVNQLMSEMHEQARFYGTDFHDGSIAKIDLSSRPLHLGNEHGNQIEAETVIIAIGVSAKYLGLPGKEKCRGQGAGACTICDGFFYRKRTATVVGGGGIACEGAMYLSGLTKEVYMIARKPQLRTAEAVRKRVTGKENTEILYNINTLGLFGEDGIEGVHLVRSKGKGNEEKFDINIDGFFLAISHASNTDFFKGQLEMDDHGSIITKPKFITANIEGVSATNDMADPTYRQGVIAASAGAMAVIEADRFLQKQ